jgi:hypothetical protein
MNSKTFDLNDKLKTIDTLNQSPIDIHALRFKDLDKNDIPHEVDKDGYLIVHKAKNEEIKNEELYFDYKINSSGYRSQHFKELDTGSINIVYAGCSFTYGEGLPEEYTWPHLLTKKIEKDHPGKNVEYFNLSQPGAGVHQVIRVCFDYFKKYGNPDYLFLMLPDVMRGISWVDHRSMYETLIPDINNIEAGPFYKKYFQSVIAENFWLLASDLMHIMEQYCEAAGITLLWDGWHDAAIWPDLNYGNRIIRKTIDTPLIRTEYSKRHQVGVFPENLNALPYWECARDGGHPGTCWTVYQSESYYENLQRRKNEKG